MEQNREIKINQLPSKTWHWLHVNEAVVTVPEKMEEAAIKIEETDQLVKVKVVAGEGSLPVKAEAGKEITVVEQLGSPEEKETGMLKFHTELELQENSHIHLIQLCMPSEGQTLINKVTAKAEKNARVSVTQLFLGTGNTYSEVNAGLLGREADLTAKIGYFLQKEQKLDINLIADHRGEKTTCDITAEGTLKDKAQKLFRGTIDFKKGACGAKGSEVEEVLLLSDDIVNKTIPLILCAEEDVEGNHGATIGELDEETLFYFAARGIGRKTAENMMARAKLEKLCPEIPDEETRQLVMEQLESLCLRQQGRKMQMKRDYREDFPLLMQNETAYLDNAATAQRPACVIEREKAFYETENANPMRGFYPLSLAATESYEEARKPCVIS